MVSECGKCVSGRFARRSVRPIAVRPDQVDSPEAYLSFFKPEKKGICMERQWLHMWNPRVTKITPLKAFSPCCRVLYVIGRIDQCPDERRRANRLSNETNGISVSVSLTEALSMVFTTESEQKRERKQHILLGSINGARGRALVCYTAVFSVVTQRWKSVAWRH